VQNNSQPAQRRWGKARSRAAALWRFAFLGRPARTAVASFAAAVILGTFVLMLPISSKGAGWDSLVDRFVDCLFTATSAVCVTGLIVKSTPDHWSLFGQLVILVLIQAGGLGIMTMGAFVATMLRRRMSMQFEALMGDLVESGQEGGVGAHISFICRFALVAEVIGAVALFYAWRRHPAMGDHLWHCIYQSVFHSISAFCNAGFSLNNDSLVRYADSLPVNFIVCALIVVGGVGFIVVRDMKQCCAWHLFGRRGKRPRLSTHTRLVLLMTMVLLLIGFVVFLCIESGGALAGASPRKHLLTAIFQSVTPRTAGFNTVDMKTVAPATVFLIMVFMYVGGSPGGTAGGVKTSTVGVMVASVVATLRGRDKAEMFHHSISEETVHRVAGIILLSLVALGTGTFVLLTTEKAPFGQIIFEAVSAFGTVGLSRGLTPDLTLVGRLVVTALMFTGRLGPLALILSIASLHDRAVYKYPEDRILVG
jgi:trk system potassium uptake protein TrkH